MLSDEFKQIVINAMRWLVNKKRCKIYGFVIMPNHIHLLWKIEDGFDRAKVQGALLSFTAHEFKKRMSLDDKQLKSYQVNLLDENFNFGNEIAWLRNVGVKSF